MSNIPERLSTIHSFAYSTTESLLSYNGFTKRLLSSVGELPNEVTEVAHEFSVMVINDVSQRIQMVATVMV